jgi:hypothetical protein
MHVPASGASRHLDASMPPPNLVTVSGDISKHLNLKVGRRVSLIFFAKPTDFVFQIPLYDVYVFLDSIVSYFSDSYRVRQFEKLKRNFPVFSLVAIWDLAAKHTERNIVMSCFARSVTLREQTVENG